MVTDVSIFTAELCGHESSMQAGFDAYAQAVKHHSLMLADVQTEIEGLKQAKIENDAAVKELQQAKTENGFRLDELETKINGLLEGNGATLFQNIACDSMRKKTQPYQ